jgi:hypothetical protein
MASPEKTDDATDWRQIAAKLIAVNFDSDDAIDWRQIAVKLMLVTMHPTGGESPQDQ